MASQSDSSNGASNGTSITPASVNENRASPTENSSIFSPHSAIWRITRENVLLLGGPAAAILQIAHPEVALGVAQHSDFRRDTLGRLHRTLEAVYTVTFSPRRGVEAMAARVRASHTKVRGDSPRRYSASSPDAQLWVLATLIQLSVDSYERFVAPIDAKDREAFFHDMRVFGTYFGVALDQGPQNWEAFIRYYDDMLNHPEFGSLPVSRELARHIAYPAKPFTLRALWPFSGAVAREFLPSPLREKLGLPSHSASQMTLAMAGALLPRLLPGLPDAVRFNQRYLRARLSAPHGAAG